jgi:DNA-binding MarR family transcriptional regulator
MSEQEYLILDELYFLTDYHTLSKKLNIQDQTLQKLLISLIQKNWVNFYEKIDGESLFLNSETESNLKSYFYLASKEGLKAHNTL